MDIYSEEGTKVKFINKKGRECERKEASKYLKEGEVYTVDSIYVRGWSSEVTLKEVPNQEFNTVMFDEVEQDKIN